MQNDLIIYMATHDQKCSHINDYIIPIQVGKAANKEQFEEIVDSTGTNISLKNNTFCELTALYWIWKNTNHKYVGLCHYRRRFDIREDRVITALESKDIILPKVKKLRISIEEQYIKEHSKDDWQLMLDILKEYSPKYYEYSKKVFGNNTLYMYNMFVMSREMYNDYCEWLFPLLFKIEEQMNDIKRDGYQKRYIGFLAERLFTLYVKCNQLSIFECEVLFKDDKIWYFNMLNVVNNIIFKNRKLIGRQ